MSQYLTFSSSPSPVSPGIKRAVGTGEHAEEFRVRLMVLRRTPKEREEDGPDNKLLDEDLRMLMSGDTSAEGAAAAISATDIEFTGEGSVGLRLRSNNSAKRISSVKCWFFKMLAAVLPSLFGIFGSAPASTRRLT